MGYQFVCSILSLNLSIIFWDCLKSGYFLAAWKKANVALVHKKGNKQILNNYQLISLLPISSKLLEEIIFDTIFQYLMKINSLIQISQALYLMILVYISLFQLPMKNMPLLVPIPH